MIDKKLVFAKVPVNPKIGELSKITQVIVHDMKKDAVSKLWQQHRKDVEQHALLEFEAEHSE